MKDESKHRIGGTDYPRTLPEFDKWFPSEAACLAFLRRIRWLEGFRCPVCNCGDAWPTKRGHLRCSGCQRQVSATAGTLFDGAHKPLRSWFQAIWYITTQKQGVNALGLKRVLGLGSYRTAWAWLHKLRRAMVRPGRDRLTGEVETDETYIGGPVAGVMDRDAQNKSIVAIAAEVRGKGTGRIRMARVNDASAQSLHRFVQSAVCEGSTVRTDGWISYVGLLKLGYDHQATNIVASGDPAHVVMPRVHRVAALLGRWWLGTYQGSMSSKHMDYYLDEFTFRFNRRHSRSPGLLFYRLLQQALEVDPISYKSLIGGRKSSGG